MYFNLEKALEAKALKRNSINSYRFHLKNVNPMYEMNREFLLAEGNINI